MAKPTILTPIELTAAELDKVSGGNFNSTYQTTTNSGTVSGSGGSFGGISQSNSNRTRQSIHQSVHQTGGGVTIGGGTTSNSAPIGLSEGFSTSQAADPVVTMGPALV
jgi:hypothetical protein